MKPSLPGQSPPWGHDRYTPVRLLGRGSFGDVYLAHDRVRAHPVALKLLRADDGEALASLRREFRALADVDHPNVVRLFELHANPAPGFFTMEFIDGADLAAWVATAPPEQRWTRARASLAQLVEGLDAMHRRGLLHRDVKPCNVLVDDVGHVVLLDAGLAKHLESQRSSDQYLTGTITTMSPEQALGRRLTPASDWYAFGTLAFALAAGRLPFEGEVMEVLQTKTLRDAPSVAAFAPQLEVEDAAVIDALLRRDPALRPAADDLRRWLAASGGGRPRALADAVRRPPRFIGRAAELAVLDGALAAARAGDVVGAALLVRVVGPPGIGKTALVAHWLTSRAASDQTLALRGRCHPRESIAYAGLDGLLEVVSAAVADGRAPLVGAERAALTHVLHERGDALASAPDPANLPPEAHERRRLAHSAIARVLAALAGDRVVVVWLDDAQWAPAETTALLDTLGRTSAPWRTSLLIIETRRAPDSDGAHPDEHVHQPTAGPPCAQLTLGPLVAADAAALLREGTGGAAEPAASLLAEASGHPMLIARAVARATSAGPPPSLRALLREETQALSPDARALLEVLSVAEAPLAESLALRVAGIPGAIRVSRALAVAGLAERVDYIGHRLAPAHALIREVVLDAMPPETRRSLHGSLADALEADAAPPALVVSHLLAADRSTDAARLILGAARQASRALAFERSIGLFREALSLIEVLGRGSEDVGLVEVELAEVLGHAGRCEEAARLFLVAAERPGAERDGLVRAAADQLIRSGHVDEALALLRETLARLDLRVSRSGAFALPRVILGRARVALRGYRHRLRPADSVPPGLLARIDAGLALSAVLPLIDTIRGLEVHNQVLQAAFVAGEPSRLARALAMEAGYRDALHGGGDRGGQAGELLASARLVAEASGDPRALGIVAIMTGSSRWSVGDWPGCLAHCLEGVDLLRAHCAGVSWEVNFALTHAINALSWQGRLREHRVEARAALEDARARGDLYAEVMFTLRDQATALVVEGRVDEARATREVLARWPNRGFQVEHLVEVYQQTEVALYEGQADEAYRGITSRWRALERAQLLRVQPFRIELAALRARAALAAAEGATTRRRRRSLLGEASRLAARIGREAPAIRACVMGPPLLAGVAALEGRMDAAAHALDAGIDAADRARMGVHAAAMRMARGRIATGSADAREATAWLIEAGVADPERYAAMVVPGLRP